MLLIGMLDIRKNLLAKEIQARWRDKSYKCHESTTAEFATKSQQRYNQHHI
jgi:hypothetical protein